MDINKILILASPLLAYLLLSNYETTTDKKKPSNVNVTVSNTHEFEQQVDDEVEDEDEEVTNHIKQSE